MTTLHIAQGGLRPGRPLDGVIPAALLEDARRTITGWPGYAPTPLRALEGMAAWLGLDAVLAKDEASRFGLGSFKALGGAYAVERRARAATGPLTVATASDGNHGLSVAWGARRFGCACRIYLHEHVSPGRAALIGAMGAEVVRVAGTYDDSTARAARDCAAHGWALVSDTALDEGDDGPAEVMAGYGIMLDEVADGVEAPPTHVFVQGGCGGLAAAVVGVLCERWALAPPRFVVVEPERADCLYRSARAGRPVRAEGDLDTVMSGLSVGEVSLSAWKVLAPTVSAYMTIPDSAAVAAMRALADGRYGDLPLVAGDSGVAGLAGVIAAASDPSAAEALGLDRHARVLAFVTEGAVDREGWRALVGRAPEDLQGAAA